jgi:transposase
MKTLSEHNAEKEKAYHEMQIMNDPHPNGIACPECGHELWDLHPMVILTSDPPQKEVFCPKCKYHGYRLT